MRAPGSGPAATAPGAGGRRERAAVAAVRRALRRSRPDRYLLVRVDVPVADPLALLRPGMDPDLFHWIDRDGDGFTALGRAAVLEARGVDRFALLRERASHLMKAIDVAWDGSERDAPVPRVFGGLAFAAGAADDEPWTGFGDARFVLPELIHETRGGRAWLTLCLPPHRRVDAVELEAALARFADAVAGPRAVGPPSTNGTAPDPLSVVPVHPEGGAPEARDAYEHRVRSALQAIDGGTVAKVVVARSAMLRMNQTVAPEDLLKRLGAGPGTFRFGILASGRLLLGATPERLVAVRDGHAWTEALAGTAPSRGDDDADPLDRRDKDLHEHDLVVRTIVDALAPFASRIRTDETPRIRTAGPVRHLATEIDLELAGPAHVLALADRLHPTAAVGGWPVGAALDWLGAHEGSRRGWYASPVGWFDVNGEGELAVALRSGVFHEGLLELFAGSGVVAGSDPAAEFEETRLKMRALPEALGLT